MNAPSVWKKAQFVGKLVLCRSHIYARPLQKMTNQSDSSKVEVVGKKKLLLLPNFDECKDGVVTTFKGSPSVALRALSLSLDCLPVRTALSLRWNTDRLGLMCVTFQKTIADDARFSPTVSPICPPSCSNTPEKILQMSGTGHAQVYITKWKATRCCSQTLKSCLNVMISLKIYHPRKNKLKLSLKIFIFNVDI